MANRASNHYTSRKPGCVVIRASNSYTSRKPECVVNRASNSCTSRNPNVWLTERVIAMPVENPS